MFVSSVCSLTGVKDIFTIHEIEFIVKNFILHKKSIFKGIKDI